MNEMEDLLERSKDNIITIGWENEKEFKVLKEHGWIRNRYQCCGKSAAVP